MSFVPLYQRVKERIRVDLLSPQQSSSRLPTERDLQMRYQVSRPTISKALTALAAEGLLIKAQGKGNFVLAPPHEDTLAPSAPRRIGYIAPITGEALVQRAFRGIDRKAHLRAYHVLMGSAGNSVAREYATVQELIASGVRGLIIYPVPRLNDEATCDYLRLQPPGVPVVLIDTCSPEQGHTQVVFDNERAAYAMTTRLLSKGHQRIGIVSYQEQICHPPLAARLRGYQAALHEHGIAFDPVLLRRFHPTGDRDAEFKAILDEWLALERRPTAIIASDDIAAVELILQLIGRKLQVPKDVSVVGFDNRETARRFQPPFTTTNPDFERLGEIACDLLLDGIEAGELVPRTYVLEVPLLVRRYLEPSTLAAAPELMAR